ncbi:hypothetical protein PPACK8108_LOCUS24767 [Phakopsora pachyrhizi]|uniref:Uncharacterized protein n=1 Tax=Phakopsora pachyrhizi TaxID=170000 RepID=A0AAV0BRA3_PHAPC|nr:hypothetical protein PPACK8108_LOCUS24767 [Phakopsora pachyrhizi]
MPSLLDSLGQPVIEKMRTFSDDSNSKRSQTPHGSVARMSREINLNAQAQDCSKLIQLEDAVWKYKQVLDELNDPSRSMTIKKLIALQALEYRADGKNETLDSGPPSGGMWKRGLSLEEKAAQQKALANSETVYWDDSQASATENLHSSSSPLIEKQQVIHQVTPALEDGASNQREARELGINFSSKNLSQLPGWSSLPLQNSQ